MKNISTLLVTGILALFFSSQISAAGDGGNIASAVEQTSLAEAIKHAEMAKTNRNDAKEILQHAEMSLKYARDAEEKAVEKINVQGTTHITTSITHLEEAIKHAKLGHADVASKHIDEALNEMHESIAKKTDYLAR